MYYRFRRTGRLLILAGLIGCICLVCAGCTGTPQPTPTITPRPTATVPPQDAIEGGRFQISYDGRLTATEEIAVEVVEQGLLITSVLLREGPGFPVERRTLVLSRALRPLFYELELGTGRARSNWLAQRTEDSVSVVANNLALPAPVVLEQVEPVPDVFMEASPSALPFVVFALQLSETNNGESAQTMTYMDILDELPASRVITFTQDSAQRAVVIGSTAFRAETDAQDSFLLWLRLSDRRLYHVEFERYTFHEVLWRAAGRLPPARVTIERVSALPELVPAIPQAIPLVFRSTSGLLLAGRLFLPEGPPPHPCLVLHPGGGILSGWRSVSAALKAGFAVFTYEKPGLGESEGTYERGGFTRQAQDALLATAMLRTRSELGGPLVFVGIGEGALVGALVSAEPNGYDANVLVSSNLRSPTDGQTEMAVLNALSDMHAWDNAQRSQYRSVSFERWKAWLFEGKDELDVLGRRYSLNPLADYAALEPLEALSRAQTTILVLNGADDRWIDQTELSSALAAWLNKPAGLLELRLVEGWDGVPDQGDGALISPGADEALLGWLERLLN